jgi:DNA replication initiation complex subunit (GINS family)
MIRELERKEKETKHLQKLPDSIINDLKDYIKRKEELKETSDILELENFKNTIKRLLELRERKIVEMAMYSARTGLPPENLTQNEEELFNHTVEQLKKFRQSFFESLNKMEEKRQERIAYRVRKNIPEIVGPDLKKYKLNENDIIEETALPKELNDLLLKQGVIEEIKE